MTDKKSYADSLEGLKKIQKELLRAFIAFCESEKLSYFAMFGTMIGAARHGGFIPWDDDVDLAMPRHDYNRLLNIADKFKEPLFLQTPENDPGACPRFARLMKLDTTFIPVYYPNPMLRGGRMGCGIDILPLDEVSSKSAAERMARRAEKCQWLRLKRAPLEEMSLGEMPDWKKKNCRMLFAKSYAELTRRYHDICSRYAGRDFTRYTIPVISGSHRALFMEKRHFENFIETDFEGFLIRLPAGYAELAEMIYENGAELPDESERKPKHFGFVDTAAPYTKYTARYEDIFKGARGRKILLFGAGNMLNIYMERYGERFPPECTFDNDPEKWGKSFCGVKVRDPKELPGLLTEGARLIIISLWYREIGEQLEEMGISDYYIYIDGWKYS